MRALAILSLILAAYSAVAQDLTVITSFPPRVTEAYEKLWMQDRPVRQFQALNKNTVAAIDEIVRGNARRFDVFMASSPEAFELLAEHGAFAPHSTCRTASSSVEPFALSSVGWTRRRDSELFMPSEWNDLLRPTYAGKIAMARPARSGTTHIMIEHLLQIRGWDDGWGFVLGLAGNLSTLTARSFGVPDGVAQGRFEIGLTLDFLAQSKANTLDFRYGQPVMLTAARIGVLANAKSPESACEFLRMVLSGRGQRLLLEPNIARIPIDPEIRKDIADLPDRIEDALRLEWIRYDAGLSASRYWTVNTLFDVMITDSLAQRKSLWSRLRALEGRGDPAALAEIRAYLVRPVITEPNSSGSVDGFGLRTTRLTGMSEAQRNLTEDWRATNRAMLQEIDDRLSMLESTASK